MFVRGSHSAGGLRNSNSGWALYLSDANYKKEGLTGESTIATPYNLNLADTQDGYDAGWALE